MDTPRVFYDKFATKLIRDFLTGNPRIESAISFASSVLKCENRKSVLDLGCGIGWSTYEFSHACPSSSVEGLDLSDNLIALAKSMFSEDARRSYSCGDLTSDEWATTKSKRFDACVMLDVYEHIPSSYRPVFHGALASALSDDAVLVITCPTPLHQAFLRSQHPEGLQPVDEDVSVADLQRLAADISAEITHFEYKAIWATNDYFHAVLKRAVERKEGVPLVRPHGLLLKRLRMRHVQSAGDLLGADSVAAMRAIRPSLVGRLIARLRTAGFLF